jgi:acyl-CoA thioester hydrolase
MVVAEATCRYRATAGFDEMLDVAISVAALGTTSMRTTIEIRRGDILIVDGQLRHVFVDLATRDKAPIPAWVREALEPWTVDAAAPA